MFRRLVIILALIALSACANSGALPPQNANYAPVTGGMMEPESAPRDSAGFENDEAQTGEETLGQERVILRDANISITAADVSAKIAEITAMASEMGGWVITSNTSTSRGAGDSELIYGSVSVRVPAERLDEALNRIKTGVERVNSETVNGRDVTQQYVDLNSRLTNLETAETQLQTIMDKAATVDEVLNVHAELVRVRGEIESIRGQIQYFDEASAFSSVTVSISPVLPDVVTTQASGWNPGDSVRAALGMLLGVGQFLVDTAIFLVIVVLPPLLIVGLPLVWLFRRYRRSRRPAPQA